MSNFNLRRWEKLNECILNASFWGFCLLETYISFWRATEIFWRSTFRKACGEHGKHGASLALVIGMGDETMTGLLLRGSMAIANVSKEEDGISEQPSYAIHFKHKYCDIFHDMDG